MTLLLMLGAITIGSVLSLLGGALIFLSRKRRPRAIALVLPLGAGALLAAAFFDLLPESFTLGDPSQLILWTLAGFLSFFCLEQLSGWFHHHHSHQNARQNSQNNLLMVGDLLHNMIDGVAIAVAFLVSPVSGLVATLAISAHEVPKELGTFGILLSRGWSSRRVVAMNALTALGTLASASAVFLVGSGLELPTAPILALTAGLFIYIAASDIIPDIHEQPRRVGAVQATMLLLSVALMAILINFLDKL